MDMIRRGWIRREGKSLYVEDRGRVVERNGARKQLKSDRDRARISIEWTENEGKRKTIFYLKILGYAILALIIILMIAGYISEDSPIALLLKYLK